MAGQIGKEISLEDAARAPLRIRIAWHAEASFMQLLWRLASLLSPERASAIGGVVLRRIGPFLRKHRMVKANLRIVLPESPEAEIEAIARGSWEQLGRVIGEYPHIASICGDHGHCRVELVDQVGLPALLASGKPVVLVSGHFGNWELNAAMAVRSGFDLTVVHMPRDNPYLTQALQERRAALRCGFVTKETGIQAMLADIRSGRSVASLVDQRFDLGDSVVFFGRDAPAPLAPAVLALRLGLPLIPARVERLQGCRFRITVLPAIQPDLNLADRRLIARDMMQQVYHLFEAWILERPEQWLCIKRRWPDLGKRKWQDKLSRNPRLVQDRPADLDSGIAAG